MAHYYTREGKLIAEVPMKTKEGMRPTDIRDARKLDLIPSVTTIIRVVAKPELVKWQVEQGIKAAVRSPFDNYEEWDSYLKRMLIHADEISQQAADYGTEIHNLICNYLGGHRIERSMNWIAAPTIAEYTCEWLRREGYEVIEPERTVVNERVGAAGTLDLTAYWHGKQVIADFKTGSFLTEKDAPVYKEHNIQVAGYDDLLDGWADERHIIQISRETIGLVTRRVCTEPSKDDRMWRATHELWKALNGWEN